MKYEQMTLAMLKVIIERAIIKHEQTSFVKVQCLDFSYAEEEMLEITSTVTNHLLQHVDVTALVDDAELQFILTWDTVDDEIIEVKNETKEFQKKNGRCHCEH